MKAAESPWSWGPEKLLELPDGHQHLVVDSSRKKDASEDPCPTARHWQEIDAACADDRAWFEAHPGRSLRIREIVPREFNCRDQVVPASAADLTLAGHLKPRHYPREVAAKVAAGHLKPGVFFRLRVRITDVAPGALARTIETATDAALLQFLRRLEAAPGFEFIKRFAHDVRERIRASRPFKSRILARRSRRASRI